MTVDQTVTTPPEQGDKTSAETSNNFEELLSSIKREDGTQKYNDVAEALNALTAAQVHIKNLEQENQDYRSRATSTEELFDIINKGNAMNTEEETTTQQESITAEDVVTIFNRLKETEVKTSNKEQVMGALAETFGSSEVAATEYSKKAQELNVSTEFLDSLASSSPKAVLAYFSKKEESLGPQPTDTAGNQHLDPKKQTGVKAPERSLMEGASTEDLVSYWRSCAPEQ